MWQVGGVGTGLDKCGGVGGRGGVEVRYVWRSGWEGRGAGLDTCMCRGVGGWEGGWG